MRERSTKEEKTMYVRKEREKDKERERKKERDLLRLCLR